jgi:hypothetical protein
MQQHNYDWRGTANSLHAGTMEMTMTLETIPREFVDAAGTHFAHSVLAIERPK